MAVNVAQHLTEFTSSPPTNKALHLRLLRQAIEKSPEELQLILGEVLKLPKRQQEDLADLLRDVSLSAIISSAKVVADRLRFLTGLEALLFDAENKKRLKERSQLHRIIAQNCWLFGEEFNLSASRQIGPPDRGSPQAPEATWRRHRHRRAGEARVSKERGIVDLMLSRVHQGA